MKNGLSGLKPGATMRIMKQQISKSSRSQQSLVDFLRDQYLDKKRANSNYSVSAFSRDLGVSQSLLSRILSGDRSPTVKFAAQISTLCGVSKRQSEAWIIQIIHSAKKSAKISKQVRRAFENRDYSIEPSFLEMERFRMICRWYHLPIIYLSYIKGPSANPSWVASKLGITEVEARDAINRLKTLGMVEQVGTKLRSTSKTLQLNTTQPELSTREFHTQFALRAIENLKDQTQSGFDARLFSTVTMAVPLSRVQEFKDKISDFQKELLSSLKSNDYDEVYQLNLQFFPLTQNKESV